jgi:hexokinase
MSELASLASVSNGTPPPDEREHELESFLQPLILNEASLHTLAYQFSVVYKDLALHSDEQFLPTPVTNLPSGNETGQYLAIDVGGSNLRVAFIELLGEEDARESMAHWGTSQDGQSRGSVLMDWRLHSRSRR